ncbi:MAG: formylglycine-generating enzyme family protein [Treponema sp.]|nr:formylglycine-generating enzyme family protein [Treponema sp.]
MKSLIFILTFLFFNILLFPQSENNFVYINNGSFIMGSPSNEAGRENDESPQRQVTISSFYICIYPITQNEYQEIMNSNPSYFKGDNLPVENVSWFDAIEYCNRRSIRDGLTPVYTITDVRDTEGRMLNRNVIWNLNANGYRLPTEAEWEYACRAGTLTAFNTGENINKDNANFSIYYQKTTPVGSFEPNAWGLYDMHGNVGEWCWDWYGNYPGIEQTNPTGPTSGRARVVRGGMWHKNWQGIRSASRDRYIPTYGWFNMNTNIGLRVVRNAE